MLSIGKIALGQHRYYDQQVAQGADDYYSGRGEAPGWWTGGGTDALGLDGRVSGEQFNALIAGIDPRHPSLRLRSSPHDPKVAALDLTFSAPKSVSVLAALAPQAAGRAFVEAHDEAVNAALAYLEDTAVQVRRGPAGERVEPGGGLIAVAYRHRMSRALDPQLHTHIVAANLTQGPDGRFTALHGTPLYRAAKTAGFLYQVHLRARITERLGLEWGPVRNGAAELTAVPTGVLAGFSRRRHEMERAALAGGIGLGSKAAGQAAALATRERKHYGIDTHTWLDEVRARAGELGLGRDELEEIGRDATARLATRSQSEPVDERALGDRLTGPAGLTERSNTFDERAVLQAFAQAAGQGAPVEEVRDQAVRFARRPDVLATVRHELTSADLVACEERLIVVAVERAEGRVAVVDSRTVDRVIAAAPLRLTGEQAAVVRAVAGSGRGVEVVEALAGTGKTTTAGVIRAVYEDAGYRVVGVAPTGRGARELTDQAGVAARTLDSTLIDLELGDQLPKRCVIVFDEAGMAPTRATARLLEAAALANAKVVAIGDPAQLASVKAGGWLRAVGERVGALRLTEVMRQRDPAERRALAALHERLPRPYLDWATSHGRIDTHTIQRDACDRAIAEWAAAVSEVGVAQAVLIARDNDTRDSLNRAARDLRGEHGELGEQQIYGPLDLAVGDRVICRRNDRLLDVDNGTRGTIRHVDEDRVVIETDSHLSRQLPAAYVAGHVEHAYALTGHGVQGATVERAIVVAAPHDLTAGWSYTALTRARQHTRLLIHDHHPLSDHERNQIAPAEPHRPARREDLLARVARRMTERDDEDLAVEQLPPAGHADDPQLALPITTGPPQEHPAVRAEPLVEDVSRERLTALRARLEQLTAQRAALPIHGLQRLDQLDARLLQLADNRDRAAAALETIPPPRRWLIGRARDPHLVDRTRLTSALTGTHAQLEATLAERATLARELCDPEQIRSELDALNRVITPLRDQHRFLRHELAQRELANPAPWVHRTFGQRPTRSLANDWDNAVLRTAEYRLDHNITDPNTPLGPQPAGNEPQHREQARQTIEHDQRVLGQDHERALDIEIEL